MGNSKGASKPAEAEVATKKAKSDHPTTIKMIEECIRVRCDKGGSSYQAIKKFIEDKYNLDMKAYATHIRKALKKGIEDGLLVQVSGIIGASSGSFKLAKTTAAVTKEQKISSKKLTTKVPPSTSAKSKVRTAEKKATTSKKSPTQFTDSVVPTKGEKKTASLSKARTKKVEKSKAPAAKTTG